jgi:hypothetical protein
MDAPGRMQSKKYQRHLTGDTMQAMQPIFAKVSSKGHL